MAREIICRRYERRAVSIAGYEPTESISVKVFSLKAVRRAVSL